MSVKRILSAIVLLSMAVFVQGCIVVAVGAAAAGTVAYVKGDLKAVEAADIDTVYKAVEKAIDELGLAVTKKSKDALSAEVIARDAQDKKIQVRLKATAEGLTELSVRVGAFGNQTKSRLIYDQIKKNLD